MVTLWFVVKVCAVILAVWALIVPDAISRIRERGATSEIENIWKKRWLGHSLLAVAVLFVVAGWWVSIPSGYAITAIAVVAGIMALRSEMSGVERSAWFVIIVLFAVMELSAIKHDHKKQEGEFAQTSESLRSAISGLQAILQRMSILEALQSKVSELKNQIARAQNDPKLLSNLRNQLTAKQQEASRMTQELQILLNANSGPHGSEVDAKAFEAQNANILECQSPCGLPGPFPDTLPTGDNPFRRDLPPAVGLKGPSLVVAEQLADLVTQGYGLLAKFVKDNDARTLSAAKKSWDAHAESVVSSNLDTVLATDFNRSYSGNICSGLTGARDPDGIRLCNVLGARLDVLVLFENQLRGAPH
jgi:hypothetical protein